MAAKDRIVGELAILTIGTHQLAAVVREATVEIGMRTVDNTAINDAAEWPLGVRKYGTITATCLPEVATLDALNLVAEAGEFNFTFKPTGKTGGKTMSGKCLVTRWSYNATDQPTLMLEAQIQGAVTWGTT